MRASFIVNLLKIASSPNKIDEFSNFVFLLHQRTGCVNQTCNLGLMAQKLDQLKLKRGIEKVNNLCGICKQNRDLWQLLFLLFTNREQAFQILFILFAMFLGRI